MLVKELIVMLLELELDATINMSTDEEGNSYGDIDKSVAEGKLQRDGQRVYSLYPIDSQCPSEIFIYDNDK